MNLFLANNISCFPGSKKKRKIVGRGNASTGNMSGRGSKGQKVRSGYNIPRGFEGGQTKLARKMPKRGMSASQVMHGGEKYFVLTTRELNKLILKTNKTEIKKSDIVDFFRINKHKNTKIKLIQKGDIEKIKSLEVDKLTKGAFSQLKEKQIEYVQVAKK